MKRKPNRLGKHELPPSEWTLPKYKLVQKGREWWLEPDGVEFFLRGPDATPGSPPDPVRDHERQLVEWLALARRYSTAPECVAAVQSLLREYRAQVAEFQRWCRRVDFVRECWAREYQAQSAKIHRRGRTDPNKPRRGKRGAINPRPLQLGAPSPNLIKPRQGERDAVDPRLMQWAGELGRHILVQDDPVTVLGRLLGKTRMRGKRAKNTNRDRDIAAAVVAKMAAGMTLEKAIPAVAADFRLGEDTIKKIYVRKGKEVKAARQQI